MKITTVIAILVLALGFAVSFAEQNKIVFVLDQKGPVGPASSDYLIRGLQQAGSEKAELVVLRIDTPGGLDTSMREINKAILASTVPVVGYVTPSGARAASAGTYMLYATHVAAMAPGTNLGAATPVKLGGGSPFRLPTGDKDKADDKDKDTEKRTPRATMDDKIVNDAVAYIKGLAQLRGRNAEWAEKAVREAASLPADEALAENVVDLIAGDLDSLLRRLDGREVTVLGETRIFHTAGLILKIVEPDWRTKLLGIITNPNIAYILMLIGIYGIILEFYSPGTFVPGVLGIISLLLALYALHVLPVNYTGLALLLVGVALMIAEAFAPSFGILGIGGAAAFVIGSVMLMDTDVPGFQVSWPLVGSIAVVSAGLFVLVMTLLVRSRRRPVVSGVQEMIGETGQVIDWHGKSGRVRVHGEIWNATAATPFQSGSRVEVAGIDGLTVFVQAPRSKGDGPCP